MSFRNTKTGRTFSEDSNRDLKRFEQLVDRNLPEKVSVELEKIIVESFEQEQYQDKSTSKWQDRKEKDEGRNLLIGKGSGKLRRSIEVTHTKDEVVAKTDVEYAIVHNEGQRAGRGKGFTMPKRQFMPIPGEENKKLDDTIQRWLDTEMDKIFL